MKEIGRGTWLLSQGMAGWLVVGVNTTTTISYYYRKKHASERHKLSLVNTSLIYGNFYVATRQSGHADWLLGGLSCSIWRAMWRKATLTYIVRDHDGEKFAHKW